MPRRDRRDAQVGERVPLLRLLEAVTQPVGQDGPGRTPARRVVAPLGVNADVIGNTRPRNAVRVLGAVDLAHVLDERVNGVGGGRWPHHDPNLLRASAPQG